MIEGELLELFQWENVSLDGVKKRRGEDRRNKERTCGRVLIYAIEMSVLLDLDTEKSSAKNLCMCRENIPPNLCGRTKTRNLGTESLYWKIKKEYRKKKV